MAGSTSAASAAGSRTPGSPATAKSKSSRRRTGGGASTVKCSTPASTGISEAYDGHPGAGRGPVSSGVRDAQVLVRAARRRAGFDLAGELSALLDHHLAVADLP